MFAYKQNNYCYMRNAPQILATVWHFPKFSISGMCDFTATPLGWVGPAQTIERKSFYMIKKFQGPVKHKLCMRHTEYHVAFGLFYFKNIAHWLYNGLGLMTTTAITTALVLFLFGVRF